MQSGSQDSPRQRLNITSTLEGEIKQRSNHEVTIPLSSCTGSYLGLIHFLPAHPRRKPRTFVMHGLAKSPFHWCVPMTGDVLNIITVKAESKSSLAGRCRSAVLRRHSRHLMHSTCLQAFSSWKQPGLFAPVPISWAIKVGELCDRADPVPLNISLNICKHLWFPSPCNDPHHNPTKLRATTDPFPTQPSHGKIAINLKNEKMRKAFCHSILISVLLLSQSCASNIDLTGTAKQLPCK